MSAVHKSRVQNVCFVQGCVTYEEMAKLTIIHLWMGLSLCSATSETLNVTFVNPGENVTISCDFGANSVYWYVQYSAQPPQAILRSFSKNLEHAFYINGSKEKHAIQTNRLVIKNFTSEDSAIYYCALKEMDVFKFSKGTRLNITGKFTGDRNLTTVIQVQREILIYSNVYLIVSIIANFILIIIIIVLTTRLYTALNRACIKKLDKPQEDIMYSALQMSAAENVAKSQTACTYSEVRVPGP